MAKRKRNTNFSNASRKKAKGTFKPNTWSTFDVNMLASRVAHLPQIYRIADIVLTDWAVPHAHGEIVPGRLYKLKSIVGEDETRYLISWENDEVTGETYEDTWEPKKNANRQAREDWEKQKAEKKSP